MNDNTIRDDGLTGTSQTGTHQEGIDHIKSNLGQQTSTSNSGLTGGNDSLDRSYDGSSTSTESTQPSGGVMGTVKSMLGMGGDSQESSTTGLGSSTTGTSSEYGREGGLGSSTTGTTSGFGGLGSSTTGTSSGLGPDRGMGSSSAGYGSSATGTNPVATEPFSNTLSSDSLRGTGSENFTPGSGLSAERGSSTMSSGLGSDVSRNPVASDSELRGSGHTTDFVPGVSGPHPTYAGNMFDPHVNTTGGLSSVSGTSSSGLGREEGLMEGRGASGLSTTQGSGNSGFTSDGVALGSGSSGLGGSIGQGSSGLGRDSSATTQSTSGQNIDHNDPMAKNQNQPSTRPKDSDVTTGADPTESADPTTADTADRTGEENAGGKDNAGGNDDGDLKGRESKLSDAQAGSKRTNEDAIPTAGGEKLGSKHWGESQIVPDNPKPANDEKVSSKDGQPTSETRDNTAANTGSKHEPDAHHSNEGKEGLVDKMKHMMHKDK
ncbi:hypothetical protein LTR62_006514 [Meristemomyces frigidus]|uniref:Uncharacterized protein n=1 Tax=Meristemomyces frigidus TaxID=1508187 RepID=A0AAN7YPS5_9PEZI|nr:hypothetical protein LTR62_006514 [Meristemomyces frigidus]